MTGVNFLMTEAEFTSAVIDLAKYRGWLVCHFRPARTVKGWRTPIEGDKGFPDLVLARQGRVIFAELKVGKGALRPEQAAWAEALGNEVYLWKPADLRDTIPNALR
jgi:hypothetical protein